MAEPTKQQDASQKDQTLRILMLNDDTTVCELVGKLLDLSFECEFDPVGRGETAIQRLLERKYDLILLDSHFPDVVYDELPAAITAVYQTIRKVRHFIGGVKYWTEGERLFRLLRSPEVADLDWKTDVQSVPVIFLTAGPRSLNRAIIRTMPPVAILWMPPDFMQIISEIEKLSGVAPLAGSKAKQQPKQEIEKPPSQRLRSLMVDDMEEVCRLIEVVLGRQFACEFDWVPTSEIAIKRLLDKEYDLVFLGSLHEEAVYSALSTEISAVYQAVPKQRQLKGGVKHCPEGERLFRLMRNPEIADSGWRTNVETVPVLFVTAGPESLDWAVIRSLPPVDLVALPCGPQEIIGKTRQVLGLSPAPA